jgi:hypothetical protein
LHAATSVAAITAGARARSPAEHGSRPALAGLADHVPPHRCLDGGVDAETITMTKRLHESVMHCIAAELVVTNNRARDLLESRCVATVDDLELVERDRPSPMSKRAHAHAILERTACFTDRSG